MALHLVRHGPPLVQPGRAASAWPLDPAAGREELHRLHRVLAERATSATWHSSDEPKAVATAHLLTDGPVHTWPGLREAHRTDWFATREEFQAAVWDAFTQPGQPARHGWEPLDETRQRVTAAVAELVHQEGDELVLIGHGTAWTLLISEITGCGPDVQAWTQLRTPDLCTVNLQTHTISHHWGDF